METDRWSLSPLRGPGDFSEERGGGRWRGCPLSFGSRCVAGSLMATRGRPLCPASAGSTSCRGPGWVPFLLPAIALLHPLKIGRRNAASPAEECKIIRMLLLQKNDLKEHCSGVQMVSHKNKQGPNHTKMISRCFSPQMKGIRRAFTKGIHKNIEGALFFRRVGVR